jgi:hypothetical protein
VNSQIIEGGSFVGKRETEKRQWIGNTANVNSQIIEGGSFVGKRETEKRQFIGNTANVNTQVITGGSFVGKRETEKRKRLGYRDTEKRNTANVFSQGINGGNFIGGNGNVFNAMSGRPISGVSYSGQGNFMSGGNMRVECGANGCTNFL